MPSPSLSFDKGGHHTHATEAAPGEGNKQQSQAQNSHLLALSSVLVPVHPASQVVEGSVLVSDGLAWKREAALGLEYLAKWQRREGRQIRPALPTSHLLYLLSRGAR